MNDAESECHGLIGDGPYEDLKRQMEAVPKDCRDAAYEAIADGARYLLVHRSLSADDVRDVREIMDRIGKGIEQLKRKLRPREAREPRPAAELYWEGEALEREYVALKGHPAIWMPREDCDFLSDPNGPLASSGSGGRPRAVWRTATLARLRDLGLPAHLAEALLRAAKLTGPTPRRETSPKT